MAAIKIASDKKIAPSILAFSHQSISAFRYFSKEDFLEMMSDMNPEDIKADLERFKDLEEYEICHKIAFVLREQEKLENFQLNEVNRILHF